MTVIDILKIVDDSSAIEKIQEELLKSERSALFETRIHEIYPEINFGRKFHEDESCNTAFRCLERILVDERSIAFFIKTYQKSKTVDFFNDFMLAQVYSRARLLIKAFAGLRKDGAPNINTIKTHYSSLKKKFLEFFFKGGKNNHGLMNVQESYHF